MTSLVLGLLPVLLTRLPGITWSGVVSMLFVGAGVGPDASKMPLSPLVLRADRFWLTLAIPGGGSLWDQAAKPEASASRRGDDDCRGALQG